MGVNVYVCAWVFVCVRGSIRDFQGVLAGQEGGRYDADLAVPASWARRLWGNDRIFHTVEAWHGDTVRVCCDSAVLGYDKSLLVFFVVVICVTLG